MPKFRLNKLVRDKLREEYNRIGQKAEYRELSPGEHKKWLIKKIIEEASEIEIEGTRDSIKNELADLQQVIEDTIAIFGFTKEEINFEKNLRYNLKGGFTGGVFVDTLELTEDDPWVGYYRKRPELFSEVD